MNQTIPMSSLPLSKQAPIALSNNQAQSKTTEQLQAQTESTVQDQTNSTSQTLNKEIGDDAFLQDVFTPIKPSADTIVDEQTGEEHIDTKEMPGASAPEVEIVPTKRTLDDTSMLMDVREMAQAIGLSWYSDGFDAIAEKHKQYKYSEAQKSMLVEAWAPVIQKSGIKVSPALKILMVEGMCSGPLLALAHQNRTYRQELEEAKAKIAKMEMERNNESAAASATSTVSSNRMDNKNAWTITQDGYFQFGEKGRSSDYLSKDKLKDRPNLKTDYDQLVKWNGKELVHQVFNIPINDNGTT